MYYLYNENILFLLNYKKEKENKKKKKEIT
jgi:hypothetical protein